MKRVAPASVCYVMNDMLKDVLNYGTGVHARALGFDKPFAAKSGTTSNYRDAWFIGYSPRILTLVWVGFDDAHSVKLAGSDACIPIWTAHMNRIDGLVPDVDWKRPDDVVDRTIDPESGMLATPYCPQTRNEIYVAGTEPLSLCPLHSTGGEPSPLWQMPNSIQTEGTPDNPNDNQRNRTDQQKKDRDRGIRRLLRAIFGDGH